MNFLLPLLVGGPDIINSDLGILILCASFPIVFHNADSQKKEIYLNNKGKSGIYMWINTINGKRYVGSSSDLQRRFSAYFSVAYLTTYPNIILHRAFLKYGHSVFSLHILEYCDKSDLLIREKYYIDLYKPKYNIIQNPTVPNMLGRKHSPETIEKMSVSQKAFDRTKEKNPSVFSGQTRSKEAGSPPIMMEVFDTHTNETTIYDSTHAAARALDIPQPIISTYFANNQKKPYRGRYIFKKVTRGEGL